MRTTILSPAIALAGMATLAIASNDDAATTSIAYFHPKVYDAVRLNILSYSGTAASVVSADATATTLAIGCLEPAPSSSCLIDPEHPQTMIQGDSTWSWKGQYTVLDWHPPVTATVDYGCTYTSQSIDASCSFSYSAYGSSDGLAFSQHFDTAISLRPTWVSSAEMLVTAGVEKLSATATATTTATATKTESEESDATETETGAAAGVPGPFGALVTAAPVLASRNQAVPCQPHCPGIPARRDGQGRSRWSSRRRGHPPRPRRGHPASPS